MREKFHVQSLSLSHSLFLSFHHSLAYPSLPLSLARSPSLPYPNSPSDPAQGTLRVIRESLLPLPSSAMRLLRPLILLASLTLVEASHLSAILGESLILFTSVSVNVQGTQQLLSCSVMLRRSL